MDKSRFEFVNLKKKSTKQINTEFLLFAFSSLLSTVQLDTHKILSLYFWVAITPSFALDSSIFLPLDASDIADEEVGADAAHVRDQQAARGKIEEKLIFLVASVQGKFDLCQTSYLA